jgi:thiosulfate/3-mercaptopyruvate sulfurtransferase
MTTSVPPVRRGDFVVRRTDRWSAGRDTLAGVVIDARSPEEYAGATPHGESRGGHVPGARSLPFRELRGPDGRLLPRPALEAKLAAIGARPDTPVVAYCTGGIRSAWLVAVLADLGYAHVANYAGSMWEWSAGDPARYPLTR